MFVDTSAIVAILLREQDAATFAARLEAAEHPISAAHVILEASMRLSTVLDLEPTVADRLITRAFQESRISVVPLTEDIAHLAVAAFERFGKGRGHGAQLNFGDCLSYACAKAHGVPLLFKGNDFKATDVDVA
jgi:ribonuclease VapC